MSQIEKLKDIAQTEIIVIPIIDVSGSMAGERIASVNEAMAEVPAQLAKINEESAFGKLMIAPMEFSSGARWFAIQDNQPMAAEEFHWFDLKANGLTDYGAAYGLLNEKLTVEEKGGWMKGRGGMAPVLILISDGEPTDEYKEQLKQLKMRGWFNAATKFAVAVEGANKNILAEFTGSLESVIDTTAIKNDLASVIKIVVVTASRTVSQTSPANNVYDKNGDIVADNGGADSYDAVQKKVIDGINYTLDDTEKLFY